MTDEEMARMTDHELLAEAEKQMKQAEWCIWAACICLAIAIVSGIIEMSQ